METVLLAADTVYTLVFAGAAVLAAFQSKRDLLLARRLVIFGATIVAIRWGVWAVTTEASWPVRAAVGALIGAALFALVPGAIHWVSGKLSSEPKHAVETPSVRESLFNSQLQEVLALQNFIGGKDEIGLRNLFDLIEIVNLNLLRNKLVILKKTDELAAVDARFAGGEDAVFPEAYVITQDPKTLRTEGTVKPGWIGMIRLTKKYIDNRQELEKYTSSMQMPADILGTVRNLHNDVIATIKIIFDVLNQKYKEDPNYVTQFDEANSKYWAAIKNNIWKQINLKPLADAIVGETRKYLKV